jgi:hypothetical protein
MKTLLLFPRLLLLVSLLCMSLIAQASHFRYGSITYQTSGANNRVVTFKVSEAWRDDAFGTPPTLGQVVTVDGNLSFGDGTSAVPINLTVTTVGDDYFYGEATITHTYAASGNYTAFTTTCCRISNLQNNADGDFYISTVVGAGSANDSPVSTLPPITNLAVGQAAATYQVPAGDPNGNPLVYSLATSADLGGIGFTNAPGLTINPATGVVTFNTVGRPLQALYNAVVKISDGTTSIIVDHIIKIIAQTSVAPVFVYPPTPTNGQVFSVTPGQLVTFQVRATDSDPGDIVTLQALGLPAGATMSPMLPTSGNPVQSTFSWTPTAANIGTTVINFIAQDNQGTQRSTSVTIQVSSGCALQLTTAVTNAGCGVAGAINLTVTGGTGPYIFAWTGPNGFTASTEDLNGLAAGTYSVTVTDNATQCAATTTATVTSTGTDTTPPVLRAAGFITALESNGTRTIEAADVDWGSFDTCSGIASMSISPSTFTCANIGPNNVTLTVTDNAGNSASETVVVLLVDNAAPVLRVAGFQTQLQNGTRTILPVDIDYGSFDNCGSVASMSISPSTFTCANVGPNQVTFTATDNSGNVSSETVTVVIQADGTCAPAARTAGNSTSIAAGPAQELQVYPNPAGPQATLSFAAERTEAAQVLVYNQLGRVVATLYQGPVQAGQRYSFTLKSQDLPAGLYSCQVRTAGATAKTTRLLVVK